MGQIDISVIINSLGKGGAEKLASLIFPRLVQSKFSSQLLVLSDHENVESYLQNLQMVKQQMTILHNANLYKVGLIKTIAHFVRDSRVIHCHLFPTVAWVILAKKIFRLPGKIVYTEHGIINKENNAIRKQVIRWIYKNCDAMISLTDDMKLKMGEYTKELSKIRTIENGIDVDAINKIEPSNRDSLYTIEGVPSTTKHFLLMTARFEKQKDHASLIKAMKDLDDNVVLLLAGEGELMQEQKDLVAQLGLSQKVIFLGFRSDVISLMKAVDINILSTHFEGLSGVVLEGLAAGVPFLGADVAGVREVLPNADFKYEHLNLEQLCTKINHVLKNEELKKNMIQTAQSHVKKYSLDRMFELHMNLYQELIDQQKSEKA
jgi:glycosyltransferase involved in cell wall biosynthesis